MFHSVQKSYENVFRPVCNSADSPVRQLSVYMHVTLREPLNGSSWRLEPKKMLKKFLQHINFG